MKFRRDEGDFLSNPSLYRQLVGSLNYLTITRPDISFAIQQVSQFMQAPRHLHLVAVHRIIRYLQGISTRGLFFPVDSPICLVAYMMLIGLVVQIPDVRLLVGVCFMVTLSFLGKVRNKIVCLNIELCHLRVLKLFGYEGY